MKNLFFIISLIFTFLIYSNKTPAQWQEIPELEYSIIYCWLVTGDSTTFVGGNNGILLRSTDSGLTWNNIMGLDFFVDTVLSLGEGSGYIFAGAYGAGSVFRSSDNGDSWSPANNGLPSAAHLNSFAFTDSVLYAATDQGVYSSIDSGSSWKADTAGLALNQSFPGDGGGIVDIVVVDSLLYIIQHIGGTVFRSPRDTILWEKISSSYYLTGYGITSIDTNLFIATQKGIFTSNGDTSWSPRNNGLPVGSGLSTCILTTLDTLLFAYVMSYSDTSGIYVSSNYGNEWEKISDGLFTSYINIIAVNKNYLFAGTQNGGWRIPVSDIISSVKVNETDLPADFYLSQNYPNPFNPVTKIRYSIPGAGFVNLKIYDVLGKEIATLVNEEKPSGIYELEFNGNNLSSGIYFYKLQAGSLSSTKKFILLK